MVENLRVKDDRYLSLFSGGRDAYRQRLQACEVLSTATISLCEEKLSGMLLQQHEIARKVHAERAQEKAMARATQKTSESTTDGHGRRGSKRIKTAEEQRLSRPVYDYGLMVWGAIFDFPRALVR